VQDVGQDHQRRQRNASRREDDVECQRDPHLGSRVRQAVPVYRHDGILRRTRAAFTFGVAMPRAGLDPSRCWRATFP
jgi:hypothetical protein